MRFMLALLEALLTNGGLFAMMERMTRGSEVILQGRIHEAPPLNFIRVKRAPQPPPTQEQRTPPEPPKQQQLPQAIDKLSIHPPRPRITKPRIQLPKLAMPLRLGNGPYLGDYRTDASPMATEGDIVPLVRIDPRYPTRALRAGIEGEVIVEFTINPDGSVVEPRILESRPTGVFDRQVLRAIKRWKFSPRVENGVAVARLATQVINFELQDR